MAKQQAKDNGTYDEATKKFFEDSARFGEQSKFMNPENFKATQQAIKEITDAQKERALIEQ